MLIGQVEVWVVKGGLAMAPLSPHQVVGSDSHKVGCQARKKQVLDLELKVHVRQVEQTNQWQSLVQR